MGTITANTLINRAVVQVMNDKNLVRFTLPTGLAWLNEGLRYVASINPSAYSDVVEQTLVAGPKQHLPANVHQLIAPRYNVSPAGAPGRAITLATHREIDTVEPEWRSGAPSGTIRHVLATDALPELYEVYPPAIAGTKIAMDMALIPPDIAAGSPIPFDDTYEGPLVDYLIHRFYQKSAEYAGNDELSNKFFAACNTKLGLKAQTDSTNQAQSKADTGSR